MKQKNIKSLNNISQKIPGCTIEIENYRKKFIEELNVLEFLKKDNKIEEDLMSVFLPDLSLLMENELNKSIQSIPSQNESLPY